MDEQEIIKKLDELAGARENLAGIVARKESEKGQVLTDEQRARLVAIDVDYQTLIDPIIARSVLLEAEIRKEAVKVGHTVHATSLMAVYVSPPVKWNADKLAGMMALIPQLANARTIGEASVQIRKR